MWKYSEVIMSWFETLISPLQDDDDYSSGLGHPKRSSYTAPVALLNDIPQGEQVLNSLFSVFEQSQRFKWTPSKVSLKETDKYSNHWCI